MAGQDERCAQQRQQAAPLDHRDKEHGGEALHFAAFPSWSPFLSLALAALQLSGGAIVENGVIVEGIETLQKNVEDGTAWIQNSSETLDWEKADIADLRALAKLASTIKAKMPELDEIVRNINTANAWTASFRKLVPKRVNKKSAESVQPLAALELLLADADAIKVIMEEKDQLRAIVAKAQRLIETINAAMEQTYGGGDDDVKDCSDAINAWKQLLKDAETSPVRDPHNMDYPPKRWP